MAQSKFSIADLLTVVAALAFGFICYLGFNFKFLGDTVKSIVWASVIAVVLGVLALLPKWMKSTDHNFKTHFILEWVFLFLFAVAAIVALFPFSHFFAVSNKENKQLIQNSINSSIRQAETLYDEYEEYANNRLKLYEGEIKTAASNKSSNLSEFINFGFERNSKVSDSKQIEKKMKVLHDQLFPSYYEDEKREHNEWLRTAKEKVTRWNPIGVMNVIGQVQNQISSWVVNLVVNSQYRAQNEKAEDFSFPVVFSSVNSIVSASYRPSLIAILAAVALYAVMLLSYFITRRHTRFPGAKLLFGGEHQKVPGEL